MTISYDQNKCSAVLCCAVHPKIFLFRPLPRLGAHFEFLRENRSRKLSFLTHDYIPKPALMRFFSVSAVI